MKAAEQYLGYCLSCCTERAGPNIWTCGRNYINGKLLSSTWGIVYHAVLKGQVLTFGRVDEIILTASY